MNFIIASHFFILASLPSGDTFFKATLFDKAAETYRQEENREKETHSLILANKPQDVIKRLKNQNPKGKELLWIALAYEAIGDLSESLKYKNIYFENNPEASFQEKISHYLESHQDDKAMELLEASSKTPESLHLLITLKKRNNASQETLNHLRKQLLMFYPKTPYHAEAAFELWSLQDYLMGEKAPLSHLSQFVKDFPESPHAIFAWYLIGLDYKKERKPEGRRRLHYKNPEKSLNAFTQSEKTFEALKETLNPEEKKFWHSLYTRAKFERVEILIDLGNEGNLAKRPLYYAYATDVLSQIPGLEAALKLAELYIEQEDFQGAMTELEKCKIDCSETPVERSLLNKSFLKRATTLYRLHDPASALKEVEKCQKMNLEKELSIEDQLGLKITKALCLKDLSQPDEAMILLSEVINSDFASSLRIKAMVMRALLYEKEGRPELAKRQYETAFLKGGIWAQQLKETWTKEFHSL